MEEHPPREGEASPPDRPLSPQLLQRALGAVIEGLRTDRGWSQTRLAQRLGLSAKGTKNLGQYEHALTEMKLLMLARLAAAFEIPASELLRLAETRGVDILRVRGILDREAPKT